MKELIEMIAKMIVVHPEDVQVRMIESDQGQVFELRVHPEDMGRVIGRNGKTINAMRTLLGAAAAKANISATLDVVE